jgi:hypothetical protein
MVRRGGRCATATCSGDIPEHSRSGAHSPLKTYARGVTVRDDPTLGRPWIAPPDNPSGLKMVLTGRLSSHDWTTLFQRLTARNWNQAPVRSKTDTHGSPGRRSFGTVSCAIVKVLERVDSDLRVRDIHDEVERLLGGPVSRSSVRATSTGKVAASVQSSKLSTEAATDSRETGTDSCGARYVTASFEPRPACGSRTRGTRPLPNS